MKKILFFWLVLFAFFTVATLTACGEEQEQTDNTVQPDDGNNETDGNGGDVVETPTPAPVVITKEMLEAVEFKDLTVKYDGNEHELLATNIPDGVTVTYKNNKKTNPGRYYASVTLTYEDLKVTKTAYLIIEKISGNLVAEAEQTVSLYGGNVYPKHTINNTEQKITYKVSQNGKTLNESALYTAGVYEVEIVANSSNLYVEESVKVTLTVKDSLYDLVFKSQTITYDGKEHTLSVNGADKLPQGYKVVYENEKGTDAGVYYAKVNVLNEKEEVVETLAAVLTIEYADDVAFDEFLDGFFYEFLEGDLLSINIFCENPAKYNFDITEFDAIWYTYEETTEEDFIEAKEYFNKLYDELAAFKDAPLSPLQKVAYNKVEDFLLENIELYNVDDIEFMRIVYVDSFGGYVADFATYMEAYTIRSEEDAIDICEFIESTETAFPSYLGFVKAKSENGYALSRHTIVEMRSFLNDILEQGADYYLSDAICARINAVSSSVLSEEQKAEYCKRVIAGMKGAYLRGVQALYDGLEEYLDDLEAGNEGYWSKYTNGQELYAKELYSLLGLKDLDIDTYISEILSEFTRTNSLVSSTQNALVKAFNISTNEQLYNVLAAYPIYNGTPDEMMTFLKEFALNIVPELESNPDIVIKEMDEASAKVSNALAYYMKSALDNTGSEYITLNPESLLKEGDPNEVLGTLAHEGYPGHLYAYVFSKEIGQHELSTIMTSTAHAEGWATYVQLALYDYARKNSEDPNFICVMDYLYANQLNSYLIYSYFDAMIHFKGWDNGDVLNWLAKNYGYDKKNPEHVDAANEIYNLLIEIPVQYSAYSYGKYFVVKLHDDAKSILGSFYDEVEFNTMILSKGWTNLGELQNTYNEYMAKKCHELGLVFSN